MFWAALLASLFAPLPIVDAQSSQAAVGISTIERTEQIRELAHLLASEDADVRRMAFERLTHLSERTLPTIEARVEEMRRERVRSVLADIEMTAFADLAEAAQPDAEILDIAPGVLTRLASHRSTEALRMAERFALVRSLETMGIPAAANLMVNIFGRDYLVWRWEAARVARRMGRRLLPSLVKARGHPNRGIHRWGVFHARRLGASSPGEAIHLVDAEAIPALLSAYASVRDMRAVPIMVAYLADRRIAVREAAQETTRVYGRNAIWQLRRSYRNHAHRAAPSAWDAERTLHELWNVLEGRRFDPHRTRFEEGQAALEAGDFEGMREAFDEVLAAHALPPVADEMARGYAALGADALEHEEFSLAAWAYRRASRLAPDAPAATAWVAEAIFADAERNLRRGLVDLDAYQAVISAGREHEEAARRIDDLATDGRSAGEERRAWAGTGAAAFLFIFAATLLRRRRETELELEPNEEEREA